MALRNTCQKFFLTRTKDFGLVVQMWTDQVGILSHPSVRGFFSQCGWNSCIESITNGVPMTCYYAYGGTWSGCQAKSVANEESGGKEGNIEKLVRTLMQYKKGKELR